MKKLLEQVGNIFKDKRGFLFLPPLIEIRGQFAAASGKDLSYFDKINTKN